MVKSCRHLILIEFALVFQIFTPLHHFVVASNGDQFTDGA